MYGKREFNGETWGDLGDGLWLCGTMIVSMQANPQGSYQTPDGLFEWYQVPDGPVSNKRFRIINTDTEESYTLYEVELEEILFNEFAKA